MKNSMSIVSYNSGSKGNYCLGAIRAPVVQALFVASERNREATVDASQLDDVNAVKIIVSPLGHLRWIAAALRDEILHHLD